MNGKVLIVLFYYNRPNLVKYSLDSVRKQRYPDWEIAMIDDGSDVPAEKVVKEHLGSLDRIKIYRINDTKEDKLRRNGVNGSLMGKYANEAIRESDADYVVMLCDDDALYPGYLQNLDHFFRRNPDKKYVYSHISQFDPTVDRPENNPPFCDHHLNKVDTIDPYYALDMSQIAFRRKACVDDEILFPFPYTVNIDAELFQNMHRKWGKVSFSGFVGQYKAIYLDNLSHRMGRVLNNENRTPHVYEIGIQ